MSDIWHLFVVQWQQQSIVEIFAFAFAVAYIWLASEESVWCWPAGFMSTALYAYVFWDVSVFYNMLLNVYYMLMAIYGYISWKKQGEDKTLISRFSVRKHIYYLALGFTLSIAVYVTSIYWFDYSLLWLDIGITVFSLMTTWLTVKKILECWIYWTVLNLSSVFLLYENALYVSVLLMAIYVVIAIKAWVQWRHTYAMLGQEIN